MTTSSRHCAVKPLRLRAEVRLYGRQFSKAHADSGGKTFFQCLNTDRLKTVTGRVEPSLAIAQPDQKFLFELFSCSVEDRAVHVAGTNSVFNGLSGCNGSLE